jgi:hypothetical protein
VPIHYVISEKKRLVVTIASGILTFAEAPAHQNRLVTDPNLNPSFDQLIDKTAVIGFQISSQEASGLARRPVLSSSSKRAFVASNPPAFGMGRLMQDISRPLRTASDGSRVSRPDYCSKVAWGGGVFATTGSVTARRGGSYDFPAPEQRAKAWKGEFYGAPSRDGSM